MEGACNFVFIYRTLIPYNLYPKEYRIMRKNVRKSFTFLLLSCCLILFSNQLKAQEVPIKNYQVNAKGQVQLTVNTDAQHYYILKATEGGDSTKQISTQIKLGTNDSIVISEALGALPLNDYKVYEYSITTPGDIDQDSTNDLIEYQDFPNKNPLNPAKQINFTDGTIAIDSFSTFEALSLTKSEVKWSEFLNGKGFVKYIITDFNSAHPKTYFINSKTHFLHSEFASVIGIDHLGDNVKKGQVIYHPTSLSDNGTLGTFAFNYSNGHGQDFEVVQKTNELLALNLPFITNNLSYFVTTNSEDEHQRDSLLYDSSRVQLLFERDLYADIKYWGLHQAEGFGFFTKIAGSELPGARDIVLYESLPNSLPRVGGIITSVIQTPLSHVNLRAIQNDIPNAYIQNPLLIDSIANLLDGYIYFKVEDTSYTIRKASLAEVNKWYEAQRPITEQNPPLNLNHTSILPLDKILFDMYDGYGAKCANIATMRSFSFPDQTVPNGFGVPFYYYQEFMKFNNFFAVAKELQNIPNFKTDRLVRDSVLNQFRKDIKDASMPQWMLNQLDSMHQTFPSGTSVRCRSSSNNEDLPGFSGAGLYTSKTQHPDEGHISKSIKQVYASLWNLRAYEEREFYKVDHTISSMGVLCHPNYTDEKSNGVGVSTDPIYDTENTYYLNSQIGEDLITNPDALSVAEEILLESNSTQPELNYTIVQRSNLVKSDTTVLGTDHLSQMKQYLTLIHNKFEKLYNAVGEPSFAMDIEYKVTSENQLVIKQARPWVAYIPSTDKGNVFEPLQLGLYPNPADNTIHIECETCNLTEVEIISASGSLMKTISFSSDVTNSTTISELPVGIYILRAYSGKKLYDTKKFIISR